MLLLFNKAKTAARTCVITLIAAIAAGTAAAQDLEPNGKPLWELGVAGGGGYLPDYPASDENHFKGLALPYAVYRGEILRAGDKGIVRGRFLKNERFEFDLSADGSFSADSDDNDAREGMDDLDFLLEVGPRLQVVLARAAKDAKIELELPVRAAFSVDFFEVKYRGVVTHPKISYQHNNFLGTKVRLKLSAGPIFATEELHDYFYEVNPNDVRAGRPLFDSDPGYLGSELQLGLSRSITENIRVFGGVQVGYFEGAANEDSPLFRDDLTVGAGIGLIWTFFQSKQLVKE